MIIKIEPTKKGSIAEETKEVFDKVLKYSNVIKRIWIFLKDIDDNYIEFSEARNKVFLKNGFTHNDRFFVSTCVGSESLNLKHNLYVELLIDDSLKPEQITFIDLPEFMPHTRKYNVYFERGSVIEYDDRYEYYISGTASIDKNGEVLHLGNIINQTHRILLIMMNMLKRYDSNLKEINTMTWYFRNKNDIPEIKRLMKMKGRDLFNENIQLRFIEGKICRPEWLLESDCSIIKRK